MDIEQLIQNVLSEDPNLFIPVAAGCVLVVGGILIGLFRGMTGGVVVALLFGGLMAASPVLLGKVAPGMPETEAAPAAPAPADTLTARVARQAGELALMNSDALTGLTRVVNSMRLALDGFEQVNAPSGDVASEAPDGATRFRDSLDAAAAQLDEASTALDRINGLRTRLESDISELESADGATSETTSAPAPQ